MIPKDLTPVVHEGHVIDVLRRFPEASVHTVVTSPPYWGLRSYGTPPQVWGGDPTHEHSWARTPPRRSDQPKQTIAGERKTAEHVHEEGDRCECGAWRGELGNEPTPELFTSHLADVFDEVRRVLRPDGTVWLNLGDTYATHPSGLKGEKRWKASTLSRADRTGAEQAGSFDKRAPGLKPKDLAGIPWRVAFELQRRGWWLRAENIWAKPNPMPESVVDRPTRAHEQVFLLTRSARYFYDPDAVRRPLAASTLDRAMSHYSNPADNPDPESKWGRDAWRSYPVIGRQVALAGRFIGRANPGATDGRKPDGNGSGAAIDRGGTPRPGGYAQSTLREIIDGYEGHATKPYEGTGAQDPSAVKARIIAGARRRAAEAGAKTFDRSDRNDGSPTEVEASILAAVAQGLIGSNLKTVWWIPTQAWPKAHFATFPEGIPEIAIRAGTSERGVCSKCGKPWRRQVHAEGGSIGHDWHPDPEKKAQGIASKDPVSTHGRVAPDGSVTSPYRREQLGFWASCKCKKASVEPAVVLDPFGGSGTVLQVARSLGRRSVAIELKPAYARMARERAGSNVPDLSRFDAPQTASSEP